MKFFESGFEILQGFLAFPLCLPGTQVWKGKQGRLFILGVLRKAAARSKAAMLVHHSLSTFTHRPSDVEKQACTCTVHLFGRSSAFCM